MRTLSCCSLTVVVALVAAPASAHIQLSAPVQRHPDQKIGPCGVGADDARGPNVTTYAPGEKIVVTFTETVNHPGHFRVSFDDDGFDDFVDPASYEELYSNAAVLVDGIADKAGGEYMVEVTLPDIECDNCTLQVIQVMTDKPPYQPGTNDLYYQCADIKLEGPVMGTSGEPGTTGGESTGGGSTGGGTASTVGPETGGETAEPATSGSTGGSGTTGGGEEPTGGGEAGSSGAGEASGGTTSGGDASTGDTTAVPIDDGDQGGCSCRGDGGAGWLGLLALPLVWRRRRGQPRSR